MILAALGWAGVVSAQGGMDAAPSRASAAATVRLNFGPDTPLSVLLEFVSDRVGFNVVYDPQVGRTPVTLDTPVTVEVEALLPVLEMLLESRGFALVDAGQPGWKRVVEVQQLPRVAELGGAEGEAGVVSRVFRLRHVSPKQVEAQLRPFLSPQGANLIADAGRALLIVTDIRANVRRAADLLAVLDSPAGPLEVVFTPLAFTQASRAAGELDRMIAASAELRGGERPAVHVMADDRLNRLIVVGRPEAVSQIRGWVESLDTELTVATRLYELHHVTPQQVESIARLFLPADASPGEYRSVVHAEAGILAVTTRAAVHARIQELVDRLDRPLAGEANPVRFYRLKNIDAGEAFATLRAITTGGSPQGQSGSRSTPTRGTASRPPDLPEATTGRTPPPDPARAAENATVVTSPWLLQQAHVVADEITNSIVVIAEPSAHVIYASLIEQLDRRRPQVMIESTFVAVDTSSNFSLGVDVKAGDDAGQTQTFAFSRFGLSEIGDDGRLDLVPGLGFNGAVLQADVADVVIRALKSDSRAKVVSAPKILVNDNATGTISSVAEQPVTSINQGQNTDTVTFSQFVSAGTTITVTPQIAEGDFLRLEFEVSLESFQGEGSSGVPPPRQSNTVSSEVTIPDGATIVVGGINRRDVSESVSRIPFLGRIPLLEYAFSSRSTTDADSTLFVFLRPVVLREDRFEDLKYLSGRDLVDAGLADGGSPLGLESGGYPANEPMLMRSR